MERASKLVVVFAATALLAFDLAIGRAWVGALPTASTLFVLGAIGAAMDRRIVAAVLVLSCLYPALLKLSLDLYVAQLSVLWIAPLLGVMVPDALTTPWHVPRRWRAPIVMAALAIVVGTPIVVGRELDFNLTLLHPEPEAVLSGLPRHAAEWSALVGLTLLTGILWFDWLLGARALDLERWVLLPIGGSIMVMAAAAAYQLFVDIRFLNDTVYAALGRATGTILDGNLCGTLAAMGLAGAGVVFGSRPGVARWMAVPAAVLLLLAVWASGSRTALAAACIVLGWCGVTWWRDRQRAGEAPPMRSVLLAAAVVMGVLVLAVSLSGDAAIGPLRRLSLMWARQGSLTGILLELWNRNGFGAAATQLIARFPWSGIGVGSFQNFGPVLTSVGPLPGDNAQNWFRHQVVEFGLLGAAGWFWFAAVFGRAVLRPGALAWRAQPARSVVVAFAAISMLGMPTQDITAAIVFLTAAAWYVRRAGMDDTGPPLGRGTWLLIGLVTLAFGASTVHVARAELRVPYRAREIGWPYSYGLYTPEPDPGGGVQRWMARRAAALVDVQGPVLRLVVRIPHGDIGTNPVNLTLWCEGREVLDTRVASNEPVTKMVPVPEHLKQVLIEARVSRTVRPSEYGGTDTRELGAIVKWDFRP
ncbi:MAG: O-antigen ligase family protein [Vicinamibacterales bacterium]